MDSVVCPIGEGVLMFVNVRVTLAPEGSNCGRVMYMQPRTLFIEVKGSHSGWFWWNVSRCLQEHYIQARCPNMTLATPPGAVKSTGMLMPGEILALVQMTGRVLQSGT
jgi:hypothetical protein